MAFFADYLQDSLIWLPEREMGYYPVTANPYDQKYFEKYVKYARTEMGKSLNKFRLEFVNKRTNGLLVDIGVGSGSFVETRITSGCKTVGYDINPASQSWLKERDLWFDCYAIGTRIDSVSLWDVLEHIENPIALLNRVNRFVFCTLPIFQDSAHILRSKHYRKDEHRWYFTRKGLISWMKDNSFECIEHSDKETQIGRDSIETFAFKRYV